MADIIDVELVEQEFNPNANLHNLFDRMNEWMTTNEGQTFKQDMQQQWDKFILDHQENPNKNNGGV